MKHFSLRDIFWYKQETLDNEREILLNGSPEEQDFVKEQKSRRNFVYTGGLGTAVLGGAGVAFHSISHMIWDPNFHEAEGIWYYLLMNNRTLFHLTQCAALYPEFMTVTSGSILTLSLAFLYGYNRQIVESKYERLESKLE